MDGIGVALSSGGASALAQIGVLEVLLEAGIPIDFVAGTSAGSIVGAALAAGTLTEFGKAVSSFTLRRVFGLFNLVWPRGALLEFAPALTFARPFHTELIEELDKRFAAVAVDLETGDEVVFRDGSVTEAIRASCAIPGVFAPHPYAGRWLADGALVNPMPVSVARGLGARFVIAVNALVVDEAQAERFARACATPSRPRLRDQLASRLGWKPQDAYLLAREEIAEASPSSDRGVRLFAVLAQATRIVQCHIAAARLQREPPDFLINVPAGDVGVFDFHRAPELIACGREAAAAALPKIHRALSAKLPPHEKLRRWWRARRAADLVASATPAPVAEPLAE